MTRPHRIDRCPICRRSFDTPANPQPKLCRSIWPPSVRDVLPVRCELPLGHRSREHWHRPLWVGTDDLVWVVGEREPEAVWLGA